MSDLPVAAIERLIRRSGAPRVSPGAAETLRDILEEKGAEIASRAVKLSKHAGRKTVTDADIKLAR